MVPRDVFLRKIPGNTEDDTCEQGRSLTKHRNFKETYIRIQKATDEISVENIAFTLFISIEEKKTTFNIHYFSEIARDS